MITLNVEDYCHNCPEFEPDVKKDALRGEDIFGRPRMRLTETVITCEHRLRCQIIHTYIAKGGRDD